MRQGQETATLTITSQTGTQDILNHLQAIGTRAHIRSVARMGVPAENAFGVPVAQIRKLARRIGQNHVLALDLWDSGWHEARLLAVLLADPEKTDVQQIVRWLEDVVSWDLCDHLCKTLIAGRADVLELIEGFARNGVDAGEFVRRAAFSSMANVCIHHDELDENTVERFLELIVRHASDGRNYVKKSVCWALREVGKRDVHCHELALVVAGDLVQDDDRNARWVGKNALRELEILVSVPERKRLLTRKSKHGAKMS